MVSSFKNRIILFFNSYTKKELCLWKATLNYKTINYYELPIHCKDVGKTKPLPSLGLKKFTILTTISNTLFMLTLSCCEASASRCNRQWAYLAMGATPCTNARSPSKQPNIAQAPSVHKPTQCCIKKFHLDKMSLQNADL